jgi:uncharacterized membrane protein YphA (DoxX/SURF4 family)
MIEDVKRIYFVARISLAFLFIYHGLVPKILTLSEMEIAMITNHGDFLPPELSVEQVAILGGLWDCLVGIAVLVFWKQRWPILVAMLTLIVLLIDVAIFSPQYLIEAFNPVTTNIMGLVVGLISLLSKRASL